MLLSLDSLPVMKMTHGPSPVPTKTCPVPGGQCTKSHARSGRSSPSTRSKHSPARTRKSSCFDSARYIPLGLPGSSTASVMPRSPNLTGFAPSKTQRPPKASFVSQAASRTLMTNQPSVTGARPESTDSRRASSTIPYPSLRRFDRFDETCHSVVQRITEYYRREPGVWHARDRNRKSQRRSVLPASSSRRSSERPPSQERP